MVHIDVLTEESSAKEFLHNLLPRILEDTDTYNIYSFQGKQDLLKKLLYRLRAYHNYPLNTHKVIILIDRDAGNCVNLKRQLEEIVHDAGLISKRENPDNFRAITRIVIEELESWYFGDTQALHEAYPEIPKNLREKKGYEKPDEIIKPSNKLLRLLKTEYAHMTHLPKIEAAKRIAPYMSPEINTSESFQKFCEAVKACQISE